MKIWFDMDGTLADLYGVENWLEMLRSSDPTPYAIAKPLLNLSLLARLLNKVQARGIEICIVSALSKNSTPEYDEAVIEIKEKWLHNHLRSVRFDEKRFVPYWFPKNEVNAGADILFDDEARHREVWDGGKAYHPDKIFKILKSLLAA